MSSEFDCKKNKHNSYTQSSLFQIELGRDQSIEDGLSDYFDIVDDKGTCPDCEKDEVDGIRGKSIELIPPILVISLKTFSQDGNV